MKFKYGLFTFVLCITSSASAPKPAAVNKEDLKYIGCEVCENMVGALKLTLDSKKQNSPTNALNELEIIETIEQICNPHNETGEWIRSLDIVESTSKGLSYIKLVAPGGLSKCGDECVTIAKSCEMLLDNDIDADDLSNVMIKKASFSVKDLQKKVCNGMSSRCKKAATHVDPKYKRINKEFKAMEEKDLEMEKLMASMKGMGLGANMYGRDDLDDMMAGGGMGGMPGMYGGDDYEGDDFEGGGDGGMDMDGLNRYGREDEMLYNGGGNQGGFKNAKDSGYEF